MEYQQSKYIWNKQLEGFSASYHLILQCKFIHSCQWHLSPCGAWDILSRRWSLCMTQFKCSTMKTKCVWSSNFCDRFKNTESPYVHLSEEHVQNTSNSTCHLFKKQTKRQTVKQYWPGWILHWLCIHSQTCSQHFPMSTIKSFIVIRPLVIVVVSNTVEG